MTTKLTRPSAPATEAAGGWLPYDALATLEVICETLLPSLVPPRGSSEVVAAYYQRSATDLDVARRLVQMLAHERPQVHADIRQFLSLFSSAGPSMVLAGSPRPFAELSQTQRERYLFALANSPVPKLRMGYQGIKRLACLIFYSALDERGVNPNWTALRYPAPPPPPVDPPAPISPLAISGETTVDADVVVVGSGAGGSVVAAELAAAGRTVVVLEKGGYNREGDFTHLEQQAGAELFLNRGTLASSDLGVLMMAGSTLGGSTVINWMTCFRVPDDVLEEWDQRAGLQGCFTSPDLQDSFALVERRLGVNANNSQHNRPNAVLFEGAKTLGLHAGVIRRNALGCDGGCDGCNFGCRRGNSQSTMRTYLQDAYDSGARVVVRCSAQRVLVEHGQAVGVTATAEDTGTGRTYPVTVRAHTVVLAAGAVNTPALLLRSGVGGSHVGRHLRLHPTTVSVGLYPTEVNAWQGVLQSAYSDEFVHLDGLYGYKLEAAPGHPGLFGLARPWVTARDYREQMTRCAHLAPVIIVVRDRGEGSVTVDRSGEAIVNYTVSPYDRRHVAHGLRQMARIHFAAGADEVMSLQSKPTFVERSAHSVRHDQQLGEFDRQIDRNGLGPNRILMFSAHQMGTCRMGADPGTSVTDQHQRVHGVTGLYVCDTSVFPTASGVNPMLPVMGLAHRASQHIKSVVGG